MRLRKRQQREPEPPRGVKILHADGSVTECAVVCDPEDQDGLAQWIAVPPEGTVFRPGDKMTVDVLPPRTGLSLRLTEEQG